MANAEYYTILKNIFDNIFELDLKNKTLRNICSTEKILCCTPSGIRMFMNDALDTWIMNEVHPDDRDMIYDMIKSADQDDADNKKLRVQFRMNGKCCCSDHTSYSWYFGEIIKLSEELCWFCFNEIEKQKGITILNNEMSAKRKQMQWASKREAVCSRAGVVVFDWDFAEEKYWHAKGLEDYAFFNIVSENKMDENNAADFVHPDDADVFSDFMDEVRFSGKEYVSAEMRELMSSGGYQWTDVGASLFYDENKSLSRVIFSLRSTDDIRKRQEQLLSMNKLLKAVADNDDDAVLAFRKTEGGYKVKFVNQVFTDYFKSICGEPVIENSKEKYNGIDIRALFSDEQLDCLVGGGQFNWELPAEGGRQMFLIESNFNENRYIVYLSNLEKNYGPESGEETGEKSVRIITFGYFDAFVDNKPILFASDKAKELFALLVDRKGGYVSSSEAVSQLWEDEPYDEKTQSRYRKAAYNLKKTLEEYGIEYIIENKGGKRRLIPEKVNCDLYDYLSGEAQFSSLFKGIYMLNYSWGEITLSNLKDEK